MSYIKKFTIAVAIPLLLALGIFIDCQIMLHCIRPVIVDSETVYVELFGQVHEYKVDSLILEN